MSLLTQTSSQDISEEVQDIQTKVHNLQAQDGQDQRSALLISARKLVAALETPELVNSRISMELPTLNAAMRILLDLKIFQAMVGKDNTSDTTSKQADDLARSCGAEPELVKRLLKRVANDYIVEEVGVDEYALTAMTRHFAEDVNAGFFIDKYVFSPLRGSSVYTASTILNQRLPKLQLFQYSREPPRRVHEDPQVPLPERQ